MLFYTVQRRAELFLRTRLLLSTSVYTIPNKRIRENSYCFANISRPVKFRYKLPTRFIEFINEITQTSSFTYYAWFMVIRY